MREYIIRAATVADAETMARVHVDTWRTAYRGIVGDEMLGGLSYQRRRDAWLEEFQQLTAEGTIVVAQVAGEIVGLASGGPERSGDPEYDGELYAIYLRAEYQSRGIGRDLALAVAKHLADTGKHSMLVWVLSRNPARVFYERLGGIAVRQKSITIARQELEEIGYGWPDIRKVG